MRKLKLQMQISLDGFIAPLQPGTLFNWDDEVRAFSIANTKEVDTILLGRKTAEGFIPHWGKVAADPQDTDHAFGKRVTDIPKIVFSHGSANSSLHNAVLTKGELTPEINRLKALPGADMLVYGGKRFVSALIAEGLIDEYDLLMNPVIYGAGWTIFSDVTRHLPLTLVRSKQFRCGTVLLSYTSRG